MASAMRGAIESVVSFSMRLCGGKGSESVTMMRSMGAF